jgi:dethiobiotin synthase
MSKVALVTGNDTGVGKTHVSAFLAKRLSLVGPVRYVKVVETGIEDTTDSDAYEIESMAGEVIEKTVVLHSFRAALAPQTAATLEGVELSLHQLILETRQALGTAWTIVEGAGGLAVPLEPSGKDWLDFALNLPVDAMVLVVENRLGTINQTRLLESYCNELPMPCGFWLNEVRPQKKEVIYANEETMDMSEIPVWATQRHGEKPKYMDLTWIDGGMP